MAIFFLAFMVLFFGPGFFLTSLLAPTLPGCQRLPTAFILSLGLLGLPAVVLLNIQALLDALGWIALVITLTLAFLWLRQQRFGRWQSSMASSLKAARPWIASPLFWACVFGTAVALTLFFKTAAIRDFGDHWFYLHYLRHYLDFPLDPALNPLADGGITSAALFRAATNGWWVLMALLVRLSGASLMDAYWIYLPPLLMALSLLANYGLAWELFEERRAALTAVLLQLLLYLTSIGSHDWIGQGFFSRIAEDKYLVWLVLLPVSLSLTLRFARNRDRRNFILVAAAVLALFLTHPFGLLQWLFAVICFLPIYVLDAVEKRPWQKAVVLLAPLLFFGLMLILQRTTDSSSAFTYLNPDQARTSPYDTQLMLLSSTENVHLLHPHLIAQPLIILSIILSPLLLFWLRKRTAEYRTKNDSTTLWPHPEMVWRHCLLHTSSNIWNGNLRLINLVDIITLAARLPELPPPHPREARFSYLALALCDRYLPGRLPPSLLAGVEAQIPRSIQGWVETLTLINSSHLKGKPVKPFLAKWFAFHQGQPRAVWQALRFLLVPDRQGLRWEYQGDGQGWLAQWLKHAAQRARLVLKILRPST